MHEAGAQEGFPVRVPGSVLDALAGAGAVGDPFFRMNEYGLAELFRKDYVFERTFTVPEDLLEASHLDLVFDGIDTIARIVVNGVEIGKADNMHRRWRFPLSHIRAGENQLRVVLRSPVRFIEHYEAGPGRSSAYAHAGAMKGYEHIRKAHSMFGWDFAPCLPDEGIWRSVWLEAYEHRIRDISFRQSFTGNDASLAVRVTFAPEGEPGGTVECVLKDRETGETAAEMRAPVQKETDLVLTVRRVKKWWPNGLGPQPLYDLRVRYISEEGEVHEEERLTVGFRTVRIVRKDDTWGKSFEIEVNGQDIFAMGANVMPYDAVYPNRTKKRSQFLLNSCVRANMNCIRVWGGGFYPDDSFYETCDEAGLLVWQDLMFADGAYDFTDSFRKNCEEEIRFNLKRMRTHPCLALVCGSAGCEAAWQSDPEAADGKAALVNDYRDFFERRVPELVKETAPDVFYWPSSPSSGGIDIKECENSGESHYGDFGPAGIGNAEYKRHFFRFLTEFGTASFPSGKTIDTFTDPSDRNLFSRVMDSHQKDPRSSGVITDAMSRLMRFPESFAQAVYFSQICQALAVKDCAEHLRQNRGRCMGALYRQLNDTWPGTSCSGIDYYGRWKALHYMACRFFAPIAVSLKLDGDRVRIYTENETPDPVGRTAEIFVRDMKFRELAHVMTAGIVEAFSCESSMTLDLGTIPEYREMKRQPKTAGSIDERIFIEGVVTLSDGRVLRDVKPVLPWKYVDLPEPDIDVDVRTGGENEDFSYSITLSANCFAAFVELDLDNADVIFSDNDFCIASDTPVTVRIEKGSIVRGNPGTASELRQHLRIQTLRGRVR